jgi:hypothetical protein
LNAVDAVTAVATCRQSRKAGEEALQKRQGREGP